MATTRTDPPSPVEVKAGHRRFYDAITEQLDATEFGAYAYFLNLGYVSDGSTQYTRVRVPPRTPNEGSMKLALEVIADCDLTGRRVLDVGCGRGGMVHVLSRYFSPRQVVGIDLSSAAIAFNQRTHRTRAVAFCEADAEQLPFRDASFDVVTNVESSHSYPDVAAFYSEVRRVLAPGGYFLYADVLPVPVMERCIDTLPRAGFTLLRDRDITCNVLLSCDEVAERRLGAFQGNGDSSLLRNFLSAPGSGVYEGMRSGKSQFRILKLQTS